MSTLLYTFHLPNHKLLIYDNFDPTHAKRGHIYTTTDYPNQSQYCPSLSCDECFFYGGDCTDNVQSFITTKLKPTHPELFL